MTREEAIVDAVGEKVAASQDWIGGAQDAYDLVRAALPDRPGARDPLEIIEARYRKWSVPPHYANQAARETADDLRSAGLLSGGPDKDTDDSLAGARARNDELRSALITIRDLSGSELARQIATAALERVPLSPVAAGPEAEPECPITAKAARVIVRAAENYDLRVPAEQGGLDVYQAMDWLRALAAQPGGTPREGND